MKPAPGVDARSAVRGLLATGRDAALSFADTSAAFDVRDDPLPWFDGRSPEDLQGGAVNDLLDAVAQADGVIWGVTGYWGGLSGVSKNVFDLIGGGNYDQTAVRTVVTGRPSAVLAVGTDPVSAANAARGAVEALMALGSDVLPEPLVLGNPREGGWESGELSDALLDLFGAVALMRRPGVPS
jgi:NAD(P)H-dependent FMN reductase